MRRKRITLAALLVLLVCGSTLASTVIGLSIEDQVRLARFVAVGEVVSLAAVDHPEHGIETAVTFRVAEPLAGPIEPGAWIVFHTRQGEAAGVRSEVPGEADLRVGQKALVFIEEVDGRLYNLGLSMGVWNVLERDGAVAGFTRALTDGLEVVGEVEIERGPIAHRDMVSRVAWAARHPEFDHPLLRPALTPGR
jgi:hypothetical protein